MGMSRDEKLAYQRGYQAGHRNRWPRHLPPYPPIAVIENLMSALKKARNVLDGELATIAPDDEWEAKFGPAIDHADAALSAVTDWIRGELNNPDGSPIDKVVRDE